MSVGGLAVTVRLIPVAARYLLRRNLFGFDINKAGTPRGATKVPEALGIVTGIVFLVVTILLQACKLTEDSDWLVQYNGALACICFMILLGFVDDVLDVPWRVKIVLPFFAAIPLVTTYAGHTAILVPKPLVLYIFGLFPFPRHCLPRFDPETGLLIGTDDKSLVNLFLRVFGRCNEKSLCIRLLIFQAAFCLMTFGLRYILAGWYK